jgi:hypothetical protein
LDYNSQIIGLASRGFNSWRLRKYSWGFHFWFESELSASTSLILGSTPSDFHLLEKSFFWFVFEVPASISLVLVSTPSDSKFYLADYFPSDSKFEKVGGGFESHTIVKSAPNFKKFLEVSEVGLGFNFHPQHLFIFQYPQWIP